MKALFLIFHLALALGTAYGATVTQPHSTAQLLIEPRALAPGDPVTVGLHLKLEKGWHVYWKNPGDSGMATSIAWQLPDGYAAGPIQWPAPRRIDVGPITSYGYDDEVLLLTDITLPVGKHGGGTRLQAKADWLVCKEICIPASADLIAELPEDGQPRPEHASLFSTARSALPGKLIQWDAHAGLRQNDLVITLKSASAPTSSQLHSLVFIPAKEGDIEDSAAQELSVTEQGYELVVKRPHGAMPLERIAGVLGFETASNQRRSIEIDLVVGVAPAARISHAPMTLVIALGLAVVGGMILNLMPCVFPVLAIKILGVLEHAHGDRATLRRHGALYALGVLASFLAIAGLLLWLRARGEALGWGFQLQSPHVVTLLALLFCALGLNMSGVYQIGTRVQSVAAGMRLRDDRLDAIASGLLATLVATPCTAPFMGAALGYAVSQSAAEALAVFAAIGLGMSLPYLALCFFPAMLRKVPRPGPWMETLRQFLAFPLYATVAWLVWVLARQTGIDDAARLLFALVTLACALWLWGLRSGRGLLRGAGLVTLLTLTFVVAWPRSDSMHRAHGWQPWSEHVVLAALARGQPVFVDFTAAWCVSCQFNKKVVLHTDAIERAFSDKNVLRLQADWTHRDAAITQALAKLDRSGVPVYALYMPGQPKPRLLPEILTTGIVMDALAALPVRVAHATPNPTKE